MSSQEDPASSAFPAENENGPGGRVASFSGVVKT